jgi:hypothetical protein
VVVQLVVTEEVIMDIEEVMLGIQEAMVVIVEVMVDFIQVTMATIPDVRFCFQQFARIMTIN